MKISENEIITGFQNIIDTCDLINSTNFQYSITYIRSTANKLSNSVFVSYGQNMLYHNFMHIYNIAELTTSANMSHKIATIRGICIRNIDFIRECGIE